MFLSFLRLFPYFYYWYFKSSWNQMKYPLGYISPDTHTHTHAHTHTHTHERTQECFIQRHCPLESFRSIGCRWSKCEYGALLEWYRQVENQSSGSKTCSSAIINPLWTGLGSNPDYCSDRSNNLYAWLTVHHLQILCFFSNLIHFYFSFYIYNFLLTIFSTCFGPAGPSSGESNYTYSLWHLSLVRCYLVRGPWC